MDPVSAERPPPPGAPRWVKVAGIVTAVVVLLLVVLVLTGKGHGPGRHGAGGQGRPPGLELGAALR